jgi:hypothetical protein
LDNDAFLIPGKTLRLRETVPTDVNPVEMEIIEQIQEFEPNMVRTKSNSFAGRIHIESLEEPQQPQNLVKSGSKDDLSPRAKDVPESSQSLRNRLKATLNQGANISDIDKIFEHVLNESRRVNESLKQIEEEETYLNPKKSFIKIYENASLGSFEDSMNDFIEVQSETKVVKSEAYYCTKHGRVKGVLTVADTYIMYDPLF